MGAEWAQSCSASCGQRWIGADETSTRDIDFRTVTLSDCCAEETQARHEAALHTLAASLGQVCASDEVIIVWRSQPVAAAT